MISSRTWATSKLYTAESMVAHVNVSGGIHTALFKRELMLTGFVFNGVQQIIDVNEPTFLRRTLQQVQPRSALS